MKRVILILIAIVCQLSFSVKAAAPMTHIILGEKWLALFAPDYTPEEKKLFLLGTVFPDIRYLGVIKREKTHFKQVTLKKIYQTTSPFQRGMLFHSFVDEYRLRFVQKTGIEKHFVNVPRALRGTFLKLLEDQILCNEYNWTTWRQTLLTIPPEEKTFGIDMQSLTQWHAALSWYFSNTPTVLLTQIGLFEKGILTLNASTVREWSQLMPYYAQKKEMIQYVHDLIKAFDKLLQQP